jgi:hypothetical protein
MPAPAIPRRAAPPRRKQAPPPPPPPEPESEPAPVEPSAVELLASASDTPASEATETDKDPTPAVATVAFPVEKDGAVPSEEGESILEAATPPPASASPSLSPATQTEDSSLYDAAIKVEPPTPHISGFNNTQTTADELDQGEVEDELDQQEPEDEDEESPEERRKRIAEKLKEMGAVNPFAGRLGEPAQTETVAESNTEMDADAQEAVSTDQHNQYAREHHDEDGSEVDYPGGSVASPTSPTRTAPVPPVPMSVPPPPPLRPPVEVEKEYEGKDHYMALGEFSEEDGKVSSATDVDGEDEFKDVQVLSASHQWAEDGGEEGEGKHLSPSGLRASLMTCIVMNVRLEHIPSEICDVHT